MGNQEEELLSAIRNHETESVKRFLQNRSMDETVCGKSLLAWAVQLGNLELTKLLIDNETDITQQDHKGRSPLSIASYFGFANIVDLLLQNNAYIDGVAMDCAYFGYKQEVHDEVLDLFSNHGWINLYIDDLRTIPQGFKGARTVENALNLMKHNTIHMLSLDHDLGIDDKGNLLPTGYDLVKYVCSEGIRPGNRVYLHTDNVVGRDNMFHTLLAAQRREFIDTDIEVYHYPITANSYSDKQVNTKQRSDFHGG